MTLRYRVSRKKVLRELGGTRDGNRDRRRAANADLARDVTADRPRRHDGLLAGGSRAELQASLVVAGRVRLGRNLGRTVSRDREPRQKLVTREANMIFLLPMMAFPVVLGLSGFARFWMWVARRSNPAIQLTLRWNESRLAPSSGGR